MRCNGCGKHKPIQNKHLGLCGDCVYEKNHGHTRNEAPKFANRDSRIGFSKKAKVVIKKDEETYERVFNKIPNFCEECGAPLSKMFRDHDGKVLARFQYSHILPKSTYPEHRHNEGNFNRLCLMCHSRWENGDKRSMKIWNNNVKKIKIIGLDLDAIVK